MVKKSDVLKEKVKAIDFDNISTVADLMDAYKDSSVQSRALATCAIITMRMYADRKGWPLDSIQLYVAFERTPEGSMFRKQVRFTGSLSAEQQERPLSIGDKCPVHKTLSNPIEISSVIV